MCTIRIIELFIEEFLRGAMAEYARGGVAVNEAVR